MIAYGIIWDMDEYYQLLNDMPKKVKVPENLKTKEEIQDWLVEEYDCWVYGFSLKSDKSATKT